MDESVPDFKSKKNDERVIFEVEKVEPIKLDENKEENRYMYEAVIDLKTGGNFGYTFRVMPKHEMLLEAANLDLVKWITK